MGDGMNCKPGDLAVVIRDLASGLESGAIVLILDAYPKDVPAWYVDGPSLRSKWPTARSFSINDENLRPIRDQEGQDETLSWAPTKETA
jgi:hypothetical protein